MVSTFAWSGSYFTKKDDQALPQHLTEHVMKSTWNLIFAVVLVVTTSICAVEGYQLGSVPGAIGGVIVGVLASLVGWKTFDFQRSRPK